MVVAEIILGAFVNVLFEKLSSGDLIKLARSEGIYSQLDKWKNTLVQIQSLLVDAGNKHITDGAVDMWLYNLQDLAYDIDDILDDLATEAIRRKLNKETHASSSTNTSKVLKLVPTCCTNFSPHNIMYGRKMSSKLDEITTKLHNLAEQKTTLGLNVNVSINVERSNRTNRRLEETSLVDESKIMGREGDKEVLLEKLLGIEGCNQNVSIVSIVGLGGIGKTTLAKVLYNEEQVKDHFELRAWVCVSEEFDVFNISKAIFQAVDEKSQEFANLDLLHMALKEKLSNKRFLIVLDDVWNEDYMKWELLQSPFVVGAPGSKVIVTTRKNKVASVMNSFQPYDLKVLSKEKAMSLFARYALDEQNFDKHPTLKSYGEGIVKKCGRLPLALIALGRVLRMKATDDEWEEVLNSEIWNLQDGSQILPALRLSYYDLPSHLKQLFAYCSFFPKDYVFDKNKLVLLWMAEGFLNQSNGTKSKESLGREYFEDLTSRSFFQTSNDYDHPRYIMHDLINDLATRVAREFFFRLDDKTDACDVNECFEKFRHASFISEGYGAYRKFKELERAKGLRTFLPVSLNARPSFHLSNNVLAELLPKLQFLRVLSLSNHSITEVPQSIGSLKHMRYLNFSKTSIERLPEQVGDLYNLESLLVCGCSKLLSLPVSLVKLINLRHLDISDTPMLNKIPLGIGRLTSLRTLPKVIIESTNGFKISELKGLSHLEGRFSIIGMEKVINPIQAKDAKLQQKKGLDDLMMKWSDDFDDSRNHMIEYKVLKELSSHHKLRNLEILFYGGMEFPSWVGNPSFDQLTNLTLRGCRSKHLPTLGHLRSLQKLFVESMNEVRTLGFELLAPAGSSSNGVSFPSLEVLKLHDMQGWEIWSTNGGDKVGTARSFPLLRKISIKNCPKLGEVSIDLIPSLGVLHIEGCSVEVLRSMVGVSSSINTLKMKKIKGLAQLNGEVLEHLGAVEYLRIKKCDELRYLWESESEACKFLVSLRKLVVHGCKKLESVGGKEVNLGISMESVRDVSFHDCEVLKSYNCPNSIERLEVNNCSSMTSLTFPTVDDLPSTLKFLEIFLCENLEESLLQNNFLSSLQSLSIDSFHNLRSFPPAGCFVHLTKLKIWTCDNIESIPGEGFGFLPLFCLKTLEICGCRNLKLFPHEHLERLTSLERMMIFCCPKLDYSFPSGSWPPNLRILSIGRLKKPMSEWGLQNYPISLVELNLYGKKSRVVSFAMTEEDVSNTCFLLPQSLKSLSLYDFKDLESDSEILQHIPSLQFLWIELCPKLRDWPTTTTVNSVQSIRVSVLWQLIKSLETNTRVRRIVRSLKSCSVNVS